MSTTDVIGPLRIDAYLARELDRHQRIQDHQHGEYDLDCATELVKDLEDLETLHAEGWYQQCSKHRGSGMFKVKTFQEPIACPVCRNQDVTTPALEELRAALEMQVEALCDEWHFEDECGYYGYQTTRSF